jgi:hypothetical protein
MANKRRCRTCNREKALHLFYSTPKWTCKSCFRKTDAYRNQRDRTLREKYQITVDEYEKLLDWNHGRCWICSGRSGGKSLAVGHNHKNGRIRGLLCKRCNGVLARMKDDAGAFWAASIYLDADGAVVNSVLDRQLVAP